VTVIDILVAQKVGNFWNRELIVRLLKGFFFVKMASAESFLRHLICSAEIGN
jgi:hypothetical protein